MEELKHFRAEDRNRSVEEIIEEMCRSYIRVRERAAEDLARKEELERSYQADPFDCQDEWGPKADRAEG